jgi:peptidoglycan/LPS O-acetylase OafA/YrhL
VCGYHVTRKWRFLEKVGWEYRKLSSTMSQLAAAIFSNYQHAKLCVGDPDKVNVIIMAAFVLLAAVTARRVGGGACSLLNARHTEQVKGIAIFCVVLGHLWIHVTDSKANLIFSGDAVAVFLLLSGYGLTVSSQRESLSLRAFWARRFRRVMVPYWVVTGIVVVLDRCVLGRWLPPGRLALTLAGINVTEDLRHLDYARWFVTFILLWYILFYLGQLLRSHAVDRLWVLTMFVVASLLMVVHYYFMDCGWYQFLAFPAGCGLALYRDKLERLFRDYRSRCVAASGVAMLLGLSYEWLLRNEGSGGMMAGVPTLLLAQLQECTGVAIAVSAVVLVGYVAQAGIQSRLLVFLGKHSYEIFLLHGVFLIRHNPIIPSGEAWPLAAEFWALLGIVCLLAFGLSKVSSLIGDGLQRSPATVGASG